MSKDNSKEKLLKLRKQIKSKKPEFLRQDYGYKLSLPRKWTKPRGLHSKLRLNRKGHRKNVTTGFSSPKSVRGLSREGLVRIFVDNIAKLSAIDAEKQGIIIMKVGLKNRIEIIKEAARRKIKILNMKNPEAYLRNVEEMLKKKKEEKAGKEEIKKKKKEELKKKAEEKEKEKKLEETLSDEEKKEKEKEEKDKILTQKKQ